MRPAWRKLAVPAALLGFGLLVGALTAELGLRVYAHLDRRVGARLVEFDLLSVQIEPHGSVGYRQRPNAVFRYGNGTVASANGLGYRGPQISQAKPPGVVRIVLLGGSTTHGWGVNDSETIDAHMRRILASRAPERRFEVINAAFDGYDSYQLLERLRSDVLRWSPDVLIVNNGINDVRNARFQNLTDGDPRTLLWRQSIEQIRHDQLHGPSAWTVAKHYSLLLRLPAFLRQRFGTRRELSDAPVAIYPDAADYFERNLRRIAQIAATHRIPLIFATPPSSLRSNYLPTAPPERGYWIRNAEATATYRDTLASRMRGLVAELGGKGVLIIYVAPQVPPKQFLDDAHLSSDGNHTLATTFADATLELLRATARRAPASVAARADSSR